MDQKPKRTGRTLPASMTQTGSGLLLLGWLLLQAGPAPAQGNTPSEAAGKMTVPDGFAVKLVASEPEVRQPILVKFDDRGRLWVIQYLQYPNPAGLKRVQVDRWSRTVYDRIPEPPPKGPKGADRITILDGMDADGRAHQFKDFVGGLNLCTGLAFGHGGVYVLQAPYLLFYADRNRDDVPDGDPEVLLAGFGMEDAQSLANHLTWGPDGWLYGLNGSTTTCRIRGLEFQQGVWRYHPRTKEFELFCEGGGNLFGLTFDAHGNLLFSSNGGYLFFHGVQGASYQKAFGKHGPLHNLHAYGFFTDVKKLAPVRGAPTTGGTIYLGDAFPERFRGAFLAGDFLGHTASWWDVRPRGSTFEAAPGGVLLDSHDTWFCPTDLCLGPDGAMYVCDFFDKRTAHPDPDAEWDRSNGRVYKVEAKGTRAVTGLDLARLSSKELVALLRHRNGWYADQARTLLAGRRDLAVLPELRELALREDNGPLALQGLWALHVSGGFDDDIASPLLKHSDEYVRAWTVRLLGDTRTVAPELSQQLAALVGSDPSVVVRCQLAATAKRLPGKDGLPIVERLLERNLDGTDPYIPLLLWWAVEAKALSDTDELLRFFTIPKGWENDLIRANTHRLLRRYAAEGTQPAYEACVHLLAATPATHQDTMLASLDQGLAERTVGLGGIGQGDLFREAAVKDKPVATPLRTFEPLTPSLRDAVAAAWQAKPFDPLRLRLAMRADVAGAYHSVLTAFTDEKASPASCEALLAILAEMGKEDCVPVVLTLLGGHRPEKVQSAALDVLMRYRNRDITDRVIASYARMSPGLRSRARDLLLSRPDSARTFLQAVDQKKIAPTDVPVDQLRQVTLHGDKDLDALVRKHWGILQPGTPEEKLAVMRRLSNDLRAGTGDLARGKELFQKQCATCHRLFGEGGAVGPDLTNTSRADREYLLTSIVDPSAVIRREYLSYIVGTTSGAVLTGLLADQDGASVTLLDAKGERTKISRDRIEEIKESPVSLMPDNLWKDWTPEQVRDLFRYLQSNPG
jgi:putative membrane-bound dehydrogenase-like protein